MSKKKILLLGATGMAGHVVYLFLSKENKYDITSTVFKNKLTDSCIVLDVSNKDNVSQIVRSLKPDYIINCVGVLINGSSLSAANAILLNAYLPHLLADLADEVGSKLIHISTDCVFSGKKGLYSENDVRDADDIYGKSKGLGEVISQNHLTIRTSIIGPEIKKKGEGLFHWFMSQQGEINGYTQAFWGGVTTLQLARAIDISIGQEICGLVHLTNGSKISKFDLLNNFKEIWVRESVAVNPISGKFVDKSLLVSSKFDYKVPTYIQMLKDQKKWMEDHAELYDPIYHA